MELPGSNTLQVGYSNKKKDRIKGILSQLQEEIPDEVGEEELMNTLLENEEAAAKEARMKEAKAKMLRPKA